MKTRLHTLFAFAFAALVLGACSSGKEAAASGRAAGSEKREGKEFQNAFFEAMERKALADDEGAYKAFSKCAELSPGNAVSWYELARLDHLRERQDKAIENIRKAVSIDPKNYWYHQAYAGFLLEYGMYVEARKELEWLIKDHPDELQAYYDLAASYLYSEDGKGAIKTYERLEERVGIDPDVSFQKQRIFLLMGESDKALAELDRLLEAFPDAEIYAHKAAVLMDLGRMDEAERALQQVLSLDATNGNAWMMLSRLYARDGREDASWDALTKAFLSADVAIDEKIGVLLRFFNASERDPSSFDRAFILLEKLDVAHPDDPKTHSMYGDYLLREGRYREARDRFARAVELDPNHQLIWAQLTELDMQLNEWQLLVDDATNARNVFPAQPVFYLTMAIGQIQLGQHDEAIKNLNVGKSYVLDEPLLMANFWSTLGEAYYKIGEFKRSDEAYEKALTLTPNDPLVMNNYSYYLALQGRKLERAAELSLKSNELMPGTASFQDTYGWVLFKQGRHEEALEWVGKAIAGGANDGVVLEHYGDILFHLNRIDEAVDYWQQALQAGGAGSSIQKKISDRTWHDAQEP